MKSSPYRVGPWPGLTASGAGVLLGFAALLAVLQAVVGEPRRAWPDLVLLAITSLIPLLGATRLVDTPGAASAVAGAYLLPRTLLSVAVPTLDLPALLLVPALIFDVAWWLRRWPTGRTRRRTTPRPPLTRRRAIIAGTTFAVVLAAVEPPYRAFLTGDSNAWSGSEVWIAALVSALLCAALAGVTSSVPDTAS